MVDFEAGIVFAFASKAAFRKTSSISHLPSTI
jgi:hypothetical protein